jgi:hypothetical protein
MCACCLGVCASVMLMMVAMCDGESTCELCSEMFYEFQLFQESGLSCRLPLKISTSYPAITN